MLDRRGGSLRKPSLCQGAAVSRKIANASPAYWPSWPKKVGLVNVQFAGDVCVCRDAWLSETVL